MGRQGWLEEQDSMEMGLVAVHRIVLFGEAVVW